MQTKLLLDEFIDTNAEGRAGAHWYARGPDTGVPLPPLPVRYTRRVRCVPYRCFLSGTHHRLDGAQATGLCAPLVCVRLTSYHSDSSTVIVIVRRIRFPSRDEPNKKESESQLDACDEQYIFSNDCVVR